MRARLTAVQNRLYRLENAVADPRFMIAERQEELDELNERLSRRLERTLSTRAALLAGHERRLIARHPRTVIGRAKVELGLLRVQLEAGTRRGMHQRRVAFGQSSAALDALSPLGVLSRGYAIASAASGRAVRDAGTLSPGDVVTVRVARGHFAAEVKSTSSGDGEELA